MSDILFVILLLVGAFLIYRRPMARALGLPIYWDVGAGSLAIVAFIIFMVNTHVVQVEIEEGLAKQPCGSLSPQGECYNLSRAVCETAWANVDKGCRAEAEPILKERPGALLGPIVNRCKARKMDQVLRYNRVKADTRFCKAYFDYIDKQN